jgi:ComF family protein
LQSCKRNFALCENCENHLPWIGPACQLCGIGLKDANLALCGPCLLDPPSYSRCQALFDYAWPIDQFIRRFKDHDQHYFAKILGSLMANKLTPQHLPDCIIPVPLHPKRQRQRGFNQTLELARVIAAVRQWPLEKHACQRLRDTPAQRTLSASRRLTNIKAQAFVISSRLEGKKVLVIEDVVTTGTTMNAFTKALQNAGVRSVEIWACCRTRI